MAGKSLLNFKNKTLISFLLKNHACSNNLSGRQMSTNKSYRLEPVGFYQSPKVDSTYQAGQLVLNRLFGYKGIILACWEPKFYDRDILSKSVKFKTTKKEDILGGANYYLVLIDSRDLPFLTALKDGITVLPEVQDAADAIFTIPAMDYALQSDIMPYTTRELNPIENIHFTEFFRHDEEKEPCWVPTARFLLWLETRRNNFEVSSVYRETTENVRITVIPFYMGSRRLGKTEDDSIRYWRYLIRMENISTTSVKLRERLWKVFSEAGSLESFRGIGVVGFQPILSKEQPLFQYHNHVQLHAPSGHMWGSFKFERNNGSTFDVKIPAFPLTTGSSEDVESGITV